jgi:predicted nucleotidyltransferase
MFRELNNLKVFFENPSKEINVREFARILKISPATASKKLERFSKEKMLKKRKFKNFNLFQLNIENEEIIEIKKFYNLKKLKESGLIEELNKFYLKPTIILFGSFYEGFDNESSDVDLVIISEKDKEFNQKEKFEKKLKKRLQIFVVKKISEIKNKHLINNILNGTKIQGEIKWI